MSNIQIDANNRITIKGAREHNLKNVNLVLPRNKLIVMTGLSGSGKSSLAFDTIFADGQRRYMESLSSYARMFLGQMEKPDVDEITGLSPAVSIDQKTTSHNPRSTVGTVTEIYDYLRLMYARIGVPHCPVCGRVISQQTVDEMVDEVLKLPERTRFQVLAPVVRGRKGTQAKELDAARRGGYARVRIDGNMYDLDEEIKLEKNIKHTVEIVVDRLSINDTVRGRLADSIETAVALTGGLVIIDVIGGEPMEFSQNYACPEHGVSIDELSPRMFSFNNPFGACETCTGLGTFMKVDPARVIPDPHKSIRESAIKASGWYYAEGSISEMYYKALGKRYGFTLDTPIKEMSKEAVHAILYGTGTEKIEMQRENMFGSGTYMNTFEGIIPNLERRFRETGSEWVKEEIALVMSSEECPTCHGQRLKPTSLAVTVGGINIAQFCDMSVNEELEFIQTAKVSERDEVIAASIFKEVKERLSNSMGQEQFEQRYGQDHKRETEKRQAEAIERSGFTKDLNVKEGNKVDKTVRGLNALAAVSKMSSQEYEEYKKTDDFKSQKLTKNQIKILDGIKKLQQEEKEGKITSKDKRYIRTLSQMIEDYQAIGNRYSDKGKKEVAQKAFARGVVQRASMQQRQSGR